MQKHNFLAPKIRPKNCIQSLQLHFGEDSSLIRCRLSMPPKELRHGCSGEHGGGRDDDLLLSYCLLCFLCLLLSLQPVPGSDTMKRQGGRELELLQTPTPLDDNKSSKKKTVVKIYRACVNQCERRTVTNRASRCRMVTEAHHECQLQLSLTSQQF